jgi:glycosyltransferase involved in cell wall biosynthesis
MKPVLEILIPTFNRSKSAEEAIESVLACNDTRIGVRCNSNGYEPTLEKYRNIDNRVKYDSAKSNKGVHANILKVLSESNADFCMLLSDEDRINSNMCKNILNYLENLDKNISVVSCSIFHPGEEGHYWKPNKLLSELNLNDFVALSPIPTYMSGLIFQVDYLKTINISKFYKASIANAYPHIDITLHMLINGNIGLFKDKFVEKGPDIEYGGDGYSHKSEYAEKQATGNKDLNPSIYGPKARANQFYYRENHLTKLKAHIRLISLCIGKLNYLEFHFNAIINSDKNVLLPSDTNVRDEALAAYYDSKDSGEYSGSIISYFFTLLLYAPKFISYPLFIFTSFFNRVVRKFYIEYVIRTQK